MSFIAAAVQMTSGNSKRENIKKAEELLKKGVDFGATLLSLPENFSFIGTEGEAAAEAEEIECGESIDFLRTFASDNSVWLIGGSIPLGVGRGKVFNTSLLIDEKGEIAGRYNKIHLFDVDLAGGETHRESAYVEKGKTPVSIDSPYGKIGLSICYDLRFPELYLGLALDGARLIFVPSAFTLETGKDHWETLLRARAIENQVYIIAPAQFGIHNKKRRTYGNSMIVDPWGKVITRASDREMVITAEIDLSYQDEVRKRLPCLQHHSLRTDKKMDGI